MNKRSPEAQNIQTPARFLRSLWLGTCVRYTVLTLITLLFSALLANSETMSYVDTLRFFLLLPLGLCLTLAAQIRTTDKLAIAAKCLLHPLLVLGGGYLCFYLPFQIRTKPSGSQIWMMVLLGILVYAVIMGILLAVTHKTRQKNVNDEPYVRQFGNK